MYRQLILLFMVSTSLASTSGPVAFRSYEPSVFTDARKQNKLIVIDLEAVWCHWCHVMDEKTYGNAEVAKILGDKFISVKVDHEAFPDLGKRYEDYGWPATVFLDSEGRELAIRSGFVPPDDMKKLLLELVANPKPMKVSSEQKPVPASELETSLRRKIAERYDVKQGGWLRGHKYLDRYFIEDQISLALAGDAVARDRARKTLDGARKLVDPVWGGAYQYSVDGVWTEPHFEKLMSYQSDYLVAYSLAYAAWKDPRDLETAKQIASYLQRFLTSPDGTFYTSQDADLVRGVHSADFFKLSDADRLKRGVPLIDKNVYTRENGWAAEGLLALYRVSGDEAYLKRAEQALEWIVKNRASGGGFAHGTASADLYLGDQISAGSAFLSLYQAGGKKSWLAAAEGVAKFASVAFREKSGGFRSIAKVNANLPIKPVVATDENINFARFLNLLGEVTGRTEYRDSARAVFNSLLASPAVERIYFVGGMLRLRDELAGSALHLVVIGAPEEPLARQLTAEALAYPVVSRNFERLTNADIDRSAIKYPKLARPAMFVCSGSRCSLPLSDPTKIRERVDLIVGRKGS